MGLAERMKDYEAVTSQVLPPRHFYVIRVDGRAFHSVTRDMKRPFDLEFIHAMNVAALTLCDEVQGAICAYVQSDEISVIFTDLLTPDGRTPTNDSELWFGGDVNKVVSIAASIASVTFNTHLLHAVHDHTRPHFDGRVMSLPSLDEVRNYLIWRQRDCRRNAIMMIARSVLSHNDCHGLNTDQVKELLFTRHGIQISSYPEDQQFGRLMIREGYEGEVQFTHKKTGTLHTTTVNRTRWVKHAAPDFYQLTTGNLKDIVTMAPLEVGAAI